MTADYSRGSCRSFRRSGRLPGTAPHPAALPGEGPGGAFPERSRSRCSTSRRCRTRRAPPAAAGRRVFSNRSLPCGGAPGSRGADSPAPAFMIGRRTAGAGAADGITGILPADRFQRHRRVSRDRTGPEVGRVHRARERGATDLRASPGGGDAPADHQGRRAITSCHAGRRDSSSIVYFSPAAPGDLQGTIWQIPALGGAPRRIIDSVGGGDVGQRRPHRLFPTGRRTDRAGDARRRTAPMCA